MPSPSPTTMHARSGLGELGWKQIARRDPPHAHGGQSPRKTAVRISSALEAYEAAGGVIIRDLFDEKAAATSPMPSFSTGCHRKAEGRRTLSAEGWKWVKVTQSSITGSPRACAGSIRDRSRSAEEEQAKLDTLEAEYEALSVQHDGEISDEVAGAFERLEIEIDALKGRRNTSPTQ